MYNLHLTVLIVWWILLSNVGLLRNTEQPKQYVTLTKHELSLDFKLCPEWKLITLKYSRVLFSINNLVNACGNIIAVNGRLEKNITRYPMLLFLFFKIWPWKHPSFSTCKYRYVGVFRRKLLDKDKFDLFVNSRVQTLWYLSDIKDFVSWLHLSNTQYQLKELLVYQATVSSG